MTEKITDLESILNGRMRGNQLMLSGIGLLPDQACLLWESPILNDISWLDLDDNQLGDKGVSELADCKYLSNVQYLNLNSNTITDSGIEKLACSPNLPKLKRLHLKNNLIKGDGIIALFNSETLDSLQTFQINDGWTCKKRDGWRYKPQL